MATEVVAKEHGSRAETEVNPGASVNHHGCCKGGPGYATPLEAMSGPRESLIYATCVYTVFVKPPSRNNVSEPVLSSCGEESVATVCHIGIQHGGTITSGHGENSEDRKNEVLRFSMGLVSELDGITAGAGALTSVQLPSSMQPNKLSLLI